MKKISETIVFFGSGPVAAKSLALLTKHFTIEAVITKPRPPHHHGDVPVLRLAKELELPTYTVIDRKSLDLLFSKEELKSSLGVLIDFGIIVSQHVIDYFPFGIINSHFSLLPEWRGADPITFSILSGQRQTGVSLMLLTAGMDEGPLLAQAPYDLAEDATTPELTDQLIEVSDWSLQQIIPLWLSGETQPVPQEDASIAASTQITYSRKLTKADGILNWNKPAIVLEREIRAFLEWPKSRATFGTIEAIITRAHVVDLSGDAGTRKVIDKQPVICCGEQALAIDKIKPAGKKEMTGESFLAGYKAVFLE